MRQSSAVATSMTWAQKVRQRSWGSTPCSRTTPPVLSGRAKAKVLVGQSIERVRPSSRRTWGRAIVKS
jgi:hypothetical protein